MSIPPKRTRVVYKGTEIVIEYQPETKKWKWTFTITHKTTFSDIADNETEAARIARKELDKFYRMGERVLKRSTQ